MIATDSRRKENSFPMSGRRRNTPQHTSDLAFRLPLFGAILCTLIFLTACKGPHEQGVTYKQGKGLSYIEDQFGNHIPDYSTAGYKNGSAIPEVSTQFILEPSTLDQDDTERIQQAIDQLSAQPPDSNGIRGAILLKAGQYQVKGRLRISKSGVILRGEGQFEGGTVIRATGATRRSLITLHGVDPDQEAYNQSAGGRFRYRPKSDSLWEIVDEYIPSGHTVVQVAPVSGLKVGDIVILEQRMNQTWVNQLGMDSFPPRPDERPTTPWNPSDFVFQFERRITHIEGGRIHLDAALVNPIFSRFGENYLFKPALPQRIKHSGIEHLRLISEYQPSESGNHEDHAWDAVELGLAQDCWVRGVSSFHFGQSTVKVLPEAIRITVEDCAYLAPVARDGYGRKHGFISAGQQILVQRAFAEECNFPFFIPGRTCGPNVFLDCYAAGETSIVGPWRYWAMGTLWDNVHANALMIRNRGYEGGGWGWSGINHLFWNSTAFDWISVQSPINGWNWAIGSQGRRIGGSFQGLTGHISHHGKPRAPRSLYIEQLQDRKGKETAKGVISRNQETGTVYFHIRDTLGEN